MPRDVWFVALVSDDDVVSAVRVYADRMHDLLRRSGVGPVRSIEACESNAMALLDAVVNAPETVGDLAGWQFARALEQIGGRPHLDPEGAGPATGPLAGTPGEARARAALAEVGDRERAAVVLRDAYDLPPQAVAVALRTSEETADGLTAAGRLALVAAHDGRGVTELPPHDSRPPVDLRALSRLSEGRLPAVAATPLRRHVTGCPVCEEVVETLSRARRLAATLPVLAMADEARDAVLSRVAARAAAVLPTHDAVLRAVDEEEEPQRPVSLLVVVAALLLAAVLGVAVAWLLGSSGVARAAAAADLPSTAGHDRSISATRNASSSDWPVLSRGSQAVS